MREVKVDSY